MESLSLSRRSWSWRGVGGWRGYQWWQATKAAEAGAAYDAAAELDEQGKIRRGRSGVHKVATDGTAGYRVLARLRAAAAERDPKAAVAAYDAIAKDSSVGKVLQEFAARSRRAVAGRHAPLAELTQRLEPLAAPKGAFRHTARELLALAAVRASDATAAKRWFDEIIADAETPQSVRARIDVLMTLERRQQKLG